MGDESELLWGVGAVAERVGIATPTLRTWERRYGIGPSQRTEGGHRRYSETDIQRVQLMNRIVTSGVSAQSAARVALSLDSGGLVAALASEDPLYNAPGHVIATPVESVTRIVAAAAGLDIVGLTSVLADTVRDWGVLGAWVNVLAPVLREVADDVESGGLGVESQRIVLERLEAELRAVARTYAPRYVGARPLVLASVDAEAESLALLALEAALAGKGVAAFSLGFEVTGDAVAGLLRRIKPAAVYLWASSEEGARDVVLAALKADVPTPLLLGGEGWGSVLEDVVDMARDDVPVEAAPDLLATADRLFGLLQAAPTPR
ncbi:MerR family transcriptional regulator [Mumia zhuanghuii]|uniref:MerR family transcriptional regulator n=1 Tax=Mumia zhuanghuii TaxID=2585211 RepID=A0A5C4MQB2_9ACTN|nr:MerR family transcriptional regulator [Mumia zhuanghuii]TNC46245.1 MerR family transcriptional regulator [Mumia zhuanghuii]TNC47327.1 MerR family transcriptional regulator [Mumia zhuanghuii]